MSKEQRHQRILAVLRSRKRIDIAELSSEVPDVSTVTLRRDVAELAGSGLVIRTHGAVQMAAPTAIEQDAFRQYNCPPPGFVPKVVSALDNIDAIILPPVSGKGSNALRRQIRRAGIPFLAESAPQDNGVYLGPDNFSAAHELGQLAGSHSNQQQLRVLIISHAELSNTEMRADGFEEGLRSLHAGPVECIRVNGKGRYHSACEVASDVFSTRNDIDIVFGVNEQSTLAALDAGALHNTSANFYSIGGERPEFLARVADGGPLKAVCALFPTVVGAIAIDQLALKLTGTPLPPQLITPHSIITDANLEEYYSRDDKGLWMLREPVFNALVCASDALRPTKTEVRTARIGFLPHFPAHDWYRAMIQAMQQRAKRYSMSLDIIAPDQTMHEELSRIQHHIACLAVETVNANETIIIGEGVATLQFTRALKRKVVEQPPTLSGLTVITNSLDVMFELAGVSGVTTVLTGGEYREGPRCLVGPSLRSIFDRMRADRAFISVAGLSTEFGLSAVDERRALAARYFINAARHSTVLTDHTLVGIDASHHIAHLSDMDEVITDDAVLPQHRHEIRSSGVHLNIAGIPTDKPDA